MSAKPNKKKRFLALMLMMALVAMASARVEAQSYDASNVARMSTVVDEAYVLGKDDVEWSYAEPNLTLEKGDLLRTNESGMAEIQFDSTLLIRIGEESRAAIVEMGNEKVVGVDSGHVYVRATKGPDSGEGFFLTFPSGQLFTVGSTLARLDVHETGAAELRVVRGEIGLVTKPDGARSIPAGGSVSLDPEGNSNQGIVLAAKDDGFDYWSEQRDIALSTVTRPQQVPQEVVGAEDMDKYGDWVYSDTYKAEAWKPYVVEEWRPYSNGRWIYNSYSGWTWVPVEPWGYVTHHYGSWNYDPYYGWVWVPGATWYPARVSWVSYEEYVGWVPVGYYGYPVVTTYPYYVSTSYVHHADWLTFSFVLYDDFYYHHNHYSHHHDHHNHHDHHDGHDDHHDGHDDHHDGHDGDHDGHHGGGDGDVDHGGDNGAGEEGIRRWQGGTDGRAGDRYTKDQMKEWRDYVNETENGPGNRRIVPIAGDKADLNKLKDAKLRFASSADSLNLEKSRQKGAAVLQKVDHKKIIDVAGRPELQKKVSKLDSNPWRGEKIRTAAASNELPKRAVRDTAKNFDFRNSSLKADRTRVRNVVPGRSDGRVATGAAKRSVDNFSRLGRTQPELNRREIMDQVTEARKSAPAARTSTPSVQRITITDDDLKQTARRFRQERDNNGRGVPARESAQVTERGSQSWSSEIRDTRQERARETLSKRFDSDRQAVNSTSPASQERRSMQAITERAATSNGYERFKSREMPQNRVEQAWQNRQAIQTSPQVESPSARSYGEAARSRSFDRSNGVRNTQQYSRPAAPARSISQPQMSSPQPSRGGGDRSISGRSGGGNGSRDRAIRAVGQARGNRR